MVDSLSGEPVGSGSRSCLGLSIMIGIAQGDILVSCPNCGEDKAGQLDFNSSDLPSECQFTCQECSEEFTADWDDVWSHAFIDVCDRAYD